LHLVWCGVVLTGLMGLMIGGCGVCGKGVECYLSVHGGLVVLASIQRHVCNNRLRMFARYKEKILGPLLLQSVQPSRGQSKFVRHHCMIDQQ
jgi:hypothetical protein